MSPEDVLDAFPAERTGPDPTPIIWAGGPAAFEPDGGNPWLFGRVAGWLAPNAEMPIAWYYPTWEPYQGFRLHLYVFDPAGDRTGTVLVLRWRRALTDSEVAAILTLGET